MKFYLTLSLLLALLIPMLGMAQIDDQATQDQYVYAVNWDGDGRGNLAFLTNVQVTYDSDEGLTSSYFGFSGANWYTSNGEATNISTVNKSGVLTTTITGELTYTPSSGPSVHATATYMATTKATNGKPAEGLKIVDDAGKTLYDSNGVNGLLRGSIYIYLY